MSFFEICRLLTNVNRLVKVNSYSKPEVSNHYAIAFGDYHFL